MRSLWPFPLLARAVALQGTLECVLSTTAGVAAKAGAGSGRGSAVRGGSDLTETAGCLRLALTARVGREYPL